MSTSLQFEYKKGFVINNSFSIGIVNNINALQQKVENRLRFFYEEWFLDTTQGIPYFQEIFNNQVNPGLVISLINDDLYKEPDIIAIKEVSVMFNRNDRSFKYVATIDSIYGSLNINSTEVF